MYSSVQWLPVSGVFRQAYAQKRLANARIFSELRRTTLTNGKDASLSGGNAVPKRRLPLVQSAGMLGSRVEGFKFHEKKLPK